jgi:hypothetical protein
MAITLTPGSTTPGPATNSASRTLVPKVATAQAVIDSCGSDYVHNHRVGRMVSPNGKWIAAVCQDAGVYTLITRSDGSASWTLPTLNADSLPGPDFYLEPFHWAFNGRYLFLVPQCFCSIDGPGFAFVDGLGLFRLDLGNGYLETWFVPEITGYAFSFSPDQRLIAFTDHPNSGPAVHIRDLDTGDETVLHFKKKYISIGNFVWTRTGTELIMVAGLDGWEDYSNNAGFSIFSYSMKTRRLTVLVDNDKRHLFPAVGYDYETRIGSPWLSGDMLLVGDPLFGGDAWMLNIRDGEVMQYATPVLTPTFNP